MRRGRAAAVAAFVLCASSASGQGAEAPVLGVAVPPPVTFHAPVSPPMEPQPRLVPSASPAVPATDDDLFRADPETYAPRYDRRYRGGPWFLKRFARGFWPYGYGFGPVLAAPGYAAAPGAAGSPLEAPGYLRLEAQPEDAEVYVDGVYAGTAADFGAAAGRRLQPGLHRIELRADGYESVVLDVRITAGATTTLRRRLASRGAPPRPAVQAPALSAAPRAVYVIPRCYAGDAPPRREQLPAGCSSSALQMAK